MGKRMYRRAQLTLEHNGDAANRFRVRRCLAQKHEALVGHTFLALAHPSAGFTGFIPAPRLRGRTADTHPEMTLASFYLRFGPRDRREIGMVEFRVCGISGRERSVHGVYTVLPMYGLLRCADVPLYEVTWIAMHTGYQFPLPS